MERSETASRIRADLAARSMDRELWSDAFLLNRPFGRAPHDILAGWWAAALSFARSSPDWWHSGDFAIEVSGAFSELGKIGTHTDPHLVEGIYESLRSLPGMRGDNR